jgi:2-polyprenyl-3-methyl-5-hydroxy-6-metoxy-1,4-benzoquinol methylase
MKKEDLSAHLAAQTYDRNYQDIVPLGFRGYSRSYQTWERIRGLVDWSGLSVVDLGCFHGYFSFRAKEAGASKVQGLDREEVVLGTSRMIGELEGLDVEFIQWDDSQEIPECDVTLLLNALHHFVAPLECLKRIRSEWVIFEVKKEQVAMISKVFDVVEERGSYRRGRTIILGRKKGPKQGGLNFQKWGVQQHI